jgi:hypothetical protein
MSKLIALIAAAAGSLLIAVSATASPQFPQGRFASPLTAADFKRYGGKIDPKFPHPWIITIRSGRWETNEHPPFGGPYLVHGNRITFVVDHPLKAKGHRETLKWSYYRGQLTFQIVSGVGDDAAIYLAHPWRRMGS